MTDTPGYGTPDTVRMSFDNRTWDTSQEIEPPGPPMGVPAPWAVSGSMSTSSSGAHMEVDGDGSIRYYNSTGELLDPQLLGAAGVLPAVRHPFYGVRVTVRPSFGQEEEEDYIPDAKDIDVNDEGILFISDVNGGVVLAIFAKGTWLRAKYFPEPEQVPEAKTY